MTVLAPCLVCGKTVEPVYDNGEDPHALGQPYDATAFSSRGHYGSTAWDPMNPSLALEVNICDDCLRRAQTEGRVLVSYRPAVVPQVKAAVWDGSDNVPSFDKTDDAGKPAE